MAKLAFKGGKPVIRSEKFQRWPIYNGKDQKALIDVLKSKKWCRVFNGSRSERFEKEFAKYHDGRFAIAVANGTVSLQLAMRSLGVKAGDEVILPAVTFIATASSISELGAIPIFADINIETGCIDIDSIKEKITTRTKGIIGVHYGGYPIDFDIILSFCKKHGVFLIEDAAHAHGTEWNGRKIGALGDMGSFSFQETKSLSSGEGGMVLTDRKDLHDKAKLIHNIGRVMGKPGYTHYILSTNYRINEFQSALLNVQLKRLNRQTDVKHRNGIFLKQELFKLGLIPLKEDKRITKRGYYFLVLRYKKEFFANISRDRFLEALNAEGISTHKAYGFPLYKNPAFTRKALGEIYNKDTMKRVPDYRRLRLPSSEQFCNEQIVIPHQLLLSDKKNIQAIIYAFSKVKENLDELKD